LRTGASRYQSVKSILKNTLDQQPLAEPPILPPPPPHDNILDRLVHNAHRIEMRGESMRKKPGEKGEK
jgi:DNA replication protein DnaC